MNTRDNPRHGDGGRSCSYELLSIHQVVEHAAMAWLIKDVVPLESLIVVFGASGVGKTFIVLDMIVKLAIGRTWFGHECTAMPVVFVALEGRRGFWKRVRALENHHCLDHTENIRFVLGEFSLLAEDVDCLAASILEWALPGLIVIDTLNRAAPGADENSSTDMGKIIAATNRLQKLTGASVLLIHHPGKDEQRGLRGHSSLGAAADTIMEVKRDGNRYKLVVVKSKDGEDGISHGFDLQKVQIGPNGETSLVVIEGESLGRESRETQPLGRNQQIILDRFKELWRQLKIDSTGRGEEWPAGIAYQEVISALKGNLVDSNPRHQASRAKEALDRLIEMGLLTRNGEMVSLPDDS